ncbi:MAG: hypothetical protein R2818_04800 [Flavobacteriales bacterium]
MPNLATVGTVVTLRTSSAVQATAQLTLHAADGRQVYSATGQQLPAMRSASASNCPVTSLPVSINLPCSKGPSAYGRTTAHYQLIP